MRTIRGILLALLLLGAVAGCRDHKETIPSEVAEVLGLRIDRPLEVVLMSPQGPTENQRDFAEVTIAFNQPMKTMSAEAPDIETPFTLTPPAEGRFRWKGTATVSFVPNQPLRFGTEYKVTVPAGLKAAGGQTLDKEATFSFSTPGPRLVRTIPANNSQAYQQGKGLVLAFDQEVEPSKVNLSMSFDAPNKAVSALTSSPKAVARAMTEAEASELNKEQVEGVEPFVPRRSVVVDVPKLEPGATYTLRLKKGLTGEAGPIGSAQDQTLTFTTLAPLAWKAQAQKGTAAPEDGVPFLFNNEVNLKVLKDNLKIEPALELDRSDYDEEVSYTDPVLYAKLAPNTSYTVTLGKALTDIHGQTLGQDVSFTWKTGDRKPHVQMAEGIGLLEAGGKLSIPMGLVNIDSQTIKLARVEGAEIQRLAAREEGWLYQDPPYVPDGGWSVTETIKPDGPRNQITDRALDLTPVLKGRKFGFVLYQVESKAGNETFTHRGLAQVTNLGASGKFSPENSLFVATSLDKAQLLSGVEAQVFDGSGRPIWKGRSGQDGRIEAPGWGSLLGTQADNYDTPPLTLFLTQGEDQVFIRNGAFGTVYPWSFDISYRWDNAAHQPTAQAYTERGLYMPGEEVQLKGAVRDRSKGRWVNLPAKELEFELFNSRDESVEKGTLQLSEFGTFHHTLKLSPKAASGSYRVDYKLPQSLAKSWNVSEYLHGLTFRVEEFQPADFKVEVESAQKTPKMGDTLELEMKGEWLFGAPMQEESLKWSSYLTPTRYSNENYPGYDFGPQALDNGEDADSHQNLTSASGKTGADGTFKAQLPLKGIAYKGDADLTVEATIGSTNRREITGRLVLPVARGAYRIGLLPGTRFASGGQVPIKIVALDPAGQPVSGKSVKLELIRREWNSVRKSDADGSFRWISEVEDKPVSSQDVTSAGDPKEISLTAGQAGYHVVRATSEDGAGNTVISETSFYASGADVVPWARVDGDSIELVADKPKYAPGETAKILIKSPFQEATALVTYERDLILHSYTTTLKGSTPVIEVPLTEEHLPNLYVSVMLLRGRVAEEGGHPEEDTGKPAFKIGYVDLPVASDSQRLKVSLTTNEKNYGPGDEVTAQLQVTDQAGKPVSAELSLTAADVGVLNLINYQTPDFFDTFYSSMPLSVRTSESRLDVIGQRSYGGKGESQGGGGGYSSDYRENFRYTALWQPEVRTDSQGKAEVRFRLPDNLSTFRLMATAISLDTRCGKAESEIVVKKPLVLKRSAPAFARVGDNFQAGVLAVNSTDKDSTLKVALEAEGLEGDLAAKEIVVKAGEEREVLFALKASKEGTAKLRFKGDMTPESDALAYEIPISQAVQRVHLGSSGATSEKSHKETIEVPKSAVEGSAKVEVSLAPTVLGGLQASLDALVDYPHGCLEQRLSRVAPLLFTDNLVGRFGLTGWHDGKAKAAVQSNLDLIEGYVDSNSHGLKVWPDSTEASPYLTALAVRTAHQASQQGYNIKGTWLAGARGYLKSYLDGSQKSILDYSEGEKFATQAAALEALSRYDFQGRPYLNRLMERRDKMAPLGKAYLLESAHRLGDKAAVKTLSQELANSLKVENATAYFDVEPNTAPWLYSSDAHDTGVVLAALLNSGEKLPLADKVVTWLLEARGKDGTWGSTANNAAALSALWAYAQAFEGKSTPTFSVITTVSGAESQSAEFSAAKLAQQVQSFALKTGQNSLELAKKGEGRLYYNIAASFLDSQPSPAVDEGMTVMRAFSSLEDRPVQELKGGEIYKVKLSVIAPATRRFVALEDPVPAGFEVVHSDFATESSKLSALLKASSPERSWQTFCRFESYADRVMLFADTLAPGEHTYEYLVRAQTPGSYAYPATQVEEMYHPEVFGRTAAGTLTVK